MNGMTWNDVFQYFCQVSRKHETVAFAPLDPHEPTIRIGKHEYHPDTPEDAMEWLRSLGAERMLRERWKAHLS